MPVSFTTTPEGVLFIATGHSPMLKWSGACDADTVGVPAPTARPFMVGSGEGDIAGTYYAYLRFVDSQGNVSSLSPISPSMTPIGGAGTVAATASAITNIAPAVNADTTIDNEFTTIIAGTCNITSPNHGLTVRTTQYVQISDVTTTTEVNGSWEVLVLDKDTFNLPVQFVLAYTGGGGRWASLGNSITGASNATPIVITSAAHGLTTGQNVRITGVKGNTDALGVWAVTVLTANTFSLNGSAGNASYAGGGVWITGVSTITYSNLEVPTDPKVVRRQILRNTDGQVQVLYVDVDTEDLGSTTLTSTKPDEELQKQEYVPILDAQGNDLAIARYGVPPANKSVIANHLGRMFAAVDLEYSQGNVQATFGSATVTGTATEFTAAMAGRFLYVTGSDQSYEIDSVNTTTQTLTLLNEYMGATDLFAPYTIKPAPIERRLIYWSESGLPDAWPAANAIAVQEDGDDLTGLMPHGSFLYLLERSHIYRFTFQNNPATDGFIFLSTRRGCINNRCWIPVEGSVYMLDEGGIHVFSSDQSSQPISTTIQDLFRPSDSEFQINWTQSKFFHAGHFPAQEVVRFFVAMSGDVLPRHSICYNYRANRWWIEAYPVAIGASCVWPSKDASPRALMGTEAKKVWNFWSKNVTLDGPDPGAGTVRGNPTSATVMTLVDTAATFPSTGLVLSPLTIVSGPGKGQTRTISSVSGTTLRVTQPWTTLPTTASVYQIGGINWRYQTGWFRFADDEADNVRRVEAIFSPLGNAFRGTDGTVPTASSCSTDLHIYVDFGTTAINAGVDYRSSDAGGLGVTKASPHLVVDMTKSTGFVQARLDGHKELYADGWRFMSVELDGVTNKEPVVIYGLNLDGVR